MLGTVLTDVQIEELLGCAKVISNPNARWRDFPACRQKNFDVESENGASFEVYLRQNTRIAHSFSCGIFLKHPTAGTITLARYNGSCHAHQNPLENGERIDFRCHIHKATERYILAGRKPEHFAIATERYQDLDGAFWALIEDCNISGLEKRVSPEQDEEEISSQLSLF